MPFGDPDELKREKALAFRTLTQALADLVGIIEHGGKIGPELIEDPDERKALLEEVTDWFANPYEGQCSLDLVCSHLRFNAEAWSYAVRKYLSNPKRHAIVPNWRRLKVEDVIEIRVRLLQGERASALAKHYRVDSSVIRKIRTGQRWKRVRRVAA
jgi:hypothetical protein